MKERSYKEAMFTRVAILGGNANNGANAGTFYWNLNNGSGNANQNIGGQLTCYE